MQKKLGDICEIGGDYLCLYHIKNKLRIKIGSTFPRCDFAGIKCEGFWHLKKEIKEKTEEEKKKATDRKRQSQDRRKWADTDSIRERKKPKFNKWDLNTW